MPYGNSFYSDSNYKLNKSLNHSFSCNTSNVSADNIRIKNSSKLGVSISEYIRQNESIFKFREKSNSKSISPGRSNCNDIDYEDNIKYKKINNNLEDFMDQKLRTLTNVSSNKNLRDLRRKIINK